MCLLKNSFRNELERGIVSDWQSPISGEDGNNVECLE